jgi:hypothetical protein
MSEKCRVHGLRYGSASGRRTKTARLRISRKDCRVRNTRERLLDAYVIGSVEAYAELLQKRIRSVCIPSALSTSAKVLRLVRKLRGVGLGYLFASVKCRSAADVESRVVRQVILFRQEARAHAVELQGLLEGARRDAVADSRIGRLLGYPPEEVRRYVFATHGEQGRSER